MRTPLSIAVLVSWLIAPSALAQCKSDKDCKGTRICEGGQCVDAVAACTKDTDCKGDLVCQGSKCVLPGEATRRPPPPLTKPSEQEGDDPVIKTFDANLMRGVEGVGGKLIISKKRILFTSHAFNVQTGDTVILISDIKRLEKVNRLGFVPTGVDIHLKDGTRYELVISDRDGLIKLINQLRDA